VSAGSAITTIAGRALAVPGPDIDTDRIMPARFLKAITFDGLETHLFADDRLEAARQGRLHPFDDPAHAGARVLVVNGNFGCGSSREHAPQALRRWGIGAIVGESFADIFFANALSIGLPCVSAVPTDVVALLALVQRSPDREVIVDLERERATWDGGSLTIAMPAAARQALVTGDWDAAARLVEDEDAVRRTAARLPYLAKFDVQRFPPTAVC